MPKFKAQLIDDYDFNYVKIEAIVGLVQTTDLQGKIDECGLKVIAEFEKQKN